MSENTSGPSQAETGRVKACPTCGDEHTDERHRLLLLNGVQGYKSGRVQSFAQEADDDLIAAWLAPCGSCDAGLPMSCTCPTGDPRQVISVLVLERDALRAMLHDLGRRPSNARGGSHA